MPSLTKQDCAAGTRIQKVQLAPQTGKVKMSNALVGKGPICTGPDPRQQSETLWPSKCLAGWVSKWLLAQKSEEHRVHKQATLELEYLPHLEASSCKLCYFWDVWPSQRQRSHLKHRSKGKPQPSQLKMSWMKAVIPKHRSSSCAARQASKLQRFFFSMCNKNGISAWYTMLWAECPRTESTPSAYLARETNFLVLWQLVSTPSFITEVWIYSKR